MSRFPRTGLNPNCVRCSSDGKAGKFCACTARCKAYNCAGKERWVMTYSGPEMLLDTKVGEVEVTFTDDGHAHVSSNASSGYGGGDVEYRGQHWYCSVHLYAKYDWNEQPDRDPETGQWMADYKHQFTSLDPSKGWNYKVPPTYRKAIVSAMSEAVREFVKENPMILLEARLNDLANKLDAAKSAMTDADKAYRKAVTAFRRAENDHASALNAVLAESETKE